MLKVYNRFVFGLGLDYDLSKPTQELRLNAWVEPVLRALEDRCARFLIANVEEKVEEMFSASFDRFLDNIDIEIKPRFTLNSHSSLENTNKTLIPYRDWDHANFLSKVIRNTINNVDINTLEIKVIRMFQSELSTKMKKLGRSIEKLVDKKASNGPYGVAQTEVEIKQIEDMLNIGHSVVAAVYVLWHVSNILLLIFFSFFSFFKIYIYKTFTFICIRRYVII